MKSLLLALAILFIPLTSSAQDPSESEEDPTVIEVTPSPKPIPNKGPKAPAYSPLTCILMGDCLTVTCNYDVMGEVTVTNGESHQIVSESGNLGEGLILILDNYTPGAMTVTISFPGSNYIGYF